MKELVKVNIIKQSKGNTEEDLLELIYDDNSKEYVTLGDIGLLDEYKKAFANWNELKKWLEEEYQCIGERRPGQETTEIVAGKMIAYKNVLNKMQKLESKNERRIF